MNPTLLAAFSIGRMGVALILCGIVALIAVIWLAIVKLLRQQYDQILEEEAKQETALGEEPALEELVSVIPPSRLPKEKPTVFMPVPSDVAEVIDFITPAHDKVDVRSCITLSDAQRVMTDLEAERLCGTLYQTRTYSREVRATVYLDDLSNYFSPYSFINLHILKRLKKVPRSATALTIEARGVVRKPLMIVADTISLEAVKMISLTGGRAIKLKEL